jgi:hypothetical protein
MQLSPKRTSDPTPAGLLQGWVSGGLGSSNISGQSPLHHRLPNLQSDRDGPDREALVRQRPDLVQLQRREAPRPAQASSPSVNTIDSVDQRGRDLGAIPCKGVRFAEGGRLGSILGVLPSVAGEEFGLARPSLGKAHVELAGPACAFVAGAGAFPPPPPTRGRRRPGECSLPNKLPRPFESWKVGHVPGQRLGLR